MIKPRVSVRLSKKMIAKMDRYGEVLELSRTKIVEAAVKRYLKILKKKVAEVEEEE